MDLYGLIGYPLGHSFSKKYFTDKFEKEGLSNCSFENFPLENIQEFLPLVNKQTALKGMAVTIPYKQSVMPFLQSITEEAMEIGAVNCIKTLPGEMIGYNTDILGFEKSFTPLLKSTHQKALILGTGGASKAVQFVLTKLKIPYLIVSRNKTENNIIPYTAIDQSLLNEYCIIINCSPVGMSPNDNNMPMLPYEFINEDFYLYDLIYKPVETKFLQQGRLKGATVKNGHEMLELQADENWRIWQSQ